MSQALPIKKKGKAPGPSSAEQMAEMLAAHTELLPHDIIDEALRREGTAPGTLVKAVSLTATGEILNLPPGRIEKAAREFVKDPKPGTLRKIEVDLVVEGRGLPPSARTAGISGQQLLKMEGTLDLLGDDGSATNDPGTYDGIRKYGFKEGLGRAAKKVVAKNLGVDAANFNDLTVEQVLNVVADAQKRKQDNVILDKNFWNRVRAKWGASAKKPKPPAPPSGPTVTIVDPVDLHTGPETGDFTVIMDIDVEMNFTVTVYDKAGGQKAQAHGTFYDAGWTACENLFPLLSPVESFCGLKPTTSTTIIRRYEAKPHAR
jgi:hypothetical protein